MPGLKQEPANLRKIINYYENKSFDKNNLPARSPGGEKYQVDRNLNRDGVSCYCEVFSRIKTKLSPRQSNKK